MPWFPYLHDHRHCYIQLPRLDLARAGARFLVGEVLVSHTLHYTLLVFKCFFSTLDIFVAVSAIVHAAPIVGAAVRDKYARLRWTNFLFTSSISFNQQTSFFNSFLAICLLCPTISIPGLQWHLLIAMSKCKHREHIEHMGIEQQFASFESKIKDAVFFSI